MTRLEANQEYEKNFSALRERFRVRLTETEIKEAHPDAMPGDIIYRNPQPIESKDLWHLLTNYYGALMFEVCKLELNSTGLNISQPIIERELKKLEAFRSKAESLDYEDDKEKLKADYSDMFIYFRLKHGYYENLDLREGFTHDFLRESSTEARIYGRYFLFYNYLKNLLNPRYYVAEAMARKSEEAKLNDEKREVERSQERNILIDTGNYSPSLGDFLEVATIEKLNTSNTEYLKYLRVEKERYTNSRNYHMKWTGSNIGDEHGKIVTFINGEISEGLNHLLGQVEGGGITGSKPAAQKSESEIKAEKIAGVIEDFLDKFEEDEIIDKEGIRILKSILQNFFENGEIEKLKKPIFVKNGNMKKLAFTLGQIFRGLKNERLSYKYLQLGKSNISIFKGQDIDEKKFNQSNLYKYYTTKPQ